MSGKFINTEYADTMTSLIDGFKQRLKNNFYQWNDKNNTLVTYYNININMSSLDKVTKLAYDTKGEFSGIKFNQVNNFMLYGIEKVALMIDNGDFGIEAAEISGEAIILPNTLIPYQNDYFIINHEKDELLFKVITVTPDTLENGANFYKIEYKLTDFGDEDLINNNIVYSYEMIFNNIGTNLNPIVRTDTYNYIQELDNVVDGMKKFYINLFYSDRVQTFIFCYNDAHFYDPYMIEFLIRTNLLNGDKYVYINHQIALSSTFAIEYKDTLFRHIEYKAMYNILKSIVAASAEAIESKTNIFSTRYETYFKLIYKNVFDFVPSNIEMFTSDLLVKINDNILYDNDALYNIIIKYFNNSEITRDDIYKLDNINYENNIKLFYSLPCVIFCLESYIKSLLS
jgi:hypothetical protein